jgi:hypothetical protein
MHSALIQITRSYAACHMTTAHQRRPSLVPLVLQARYTQTTTHLVDIIQTVSRMLFKVYFFALHGLYLHPISISRKIVLATFFELGDQRFSSVLRTELYPSYRISLYGVNYDFPRGRHDSRLEIWVHRYELI